MIKYVILHHTAGNYEPNEIDLNSYQLLIDGDGQIIKGQDKTSSTAGMNSITYNISCCGGLLTTPLTKVQCEALFKATAIKLKELGLTVDKVYTHAEIGEMCRKGEISKLLRHNGYLRQNIGKIDLTRLPYDIEMPANNYDRAKVTGDFIRNKIIWYLQKI